MNNTAKIKPFGDNHGPTSANKELEPAGLSEEKLVAEIKTTADKLDAQALEQIQGDIREAQRAVSEPELPPDVEDAGVISPAKQAEEVVEKGTTLEFPVTAQAYEEGKKVSLKAKVAGGVVTGVSSIIPLTMLIGRIIKIVHKHTTGRIMKVVFRKGGQNAD